MRQPKTLIENPVSRLTAKHNTMKKNYELPESEEIIFRVENNFLQSGEVGPIHGGEDPNDDPGVTG